MKLVFNERVLRIVLFGVNFIFTILSIGLVSLGVIYIDELLKIKLYVLQTTLTPIPALLIVLGVLSFFASIAGCFFVKRHSDKYLKVYVALLMILLAIELTIASLAFANLTGELKNATTFVMHSQLKAPDQRKDEFHDIEEKFQCCGIEGIEDYKYYNTTGGVYDPKVNSSCYILLQALSQTEINFKSDDIDGCCEIVNSKIDIYSLQTGIYSTTFAVLEIVNILCNLLIINKDE